VKKYLLILVVISLTLSGCNLGQASASLIGTWNLTAYGSSASPSPALTDSGAQIIFKEDETVVGNSGCNDFGGNYTVQGDQITFSEIVSTLKLCELLMEQEEAMYQVLTGTATYRIEGNTLTLTNNDRVLVFMRASYP
jgi:heat shock protein HslJ